MENEKQEYKRPSWDEYFLQIADLIGTRGTCDRGHNGCVIVKDKHILTTGYIGAPTGLPHCDEVGHEMHTVINSDGHQSRHCIRTTHAEQNAICQAAKFGIALEGSTIYCKITPCYVCAKMIITAGIKRVVCSKIYHGGDRGKEIFAEAGIQLKVISNTLLTYADMKPKEEETTEEEKISKEEIISIPFTEGETIPIREIEE